MSSVKRKGVKRKYDSSRRTLLAAKTREQILRSARSLFSSQGYGHTSIEEIAAAAGVAAATVYSTYGSKRAILLQLLEEIEKAADASALLDVLSDPKKDERARLRAYIDFSVRLFTNDGDVVRIAQLAGMGDPDIHALWETGNARRYETCRKLLTGWCEHGSLRDDLTETDAIDILWAMSGPESYSLFVRGRNWPAARFADWLYRTAGEQLLRNP